MIFAHTVTQVLNGTKSQTRRLVKANERLILNDGSPRVEISGKRVTYQVGKSYAVQPGRGKKAAARLLLTGIRCETVESISTEDAIAEGFGSRDEFLQTWRAIHGAKAPLDQFVWVLEFQLQAIVANEIKTLYDTRQAANRGFNHSPDLSPSLTGVSGTGLHGGHYPFG